MRWMRNFALVLLTILWACASVPNQSPQPSPSTQAPIDVPLTSPSLQFFTYGDWGSGDSNQSAVAQALKNFCTQEPCDFGLLLGDNFYDFGVESVTDPLFEERFEKMYAGINVPFYVALGNHDHAGNIQAQIDYTFLPGQTRWKMPDRQFNVVYSQAGTDPLLEIFIIDSETFATADADKLRQDLAASRARWKIVALHHPIFSNGDHGDTGYLIDFLLPIVCGKVDMVLAGHDHLFSHLFANDGCNIQYFVVGTGGKSVYVSHPDTRVLFTLSDFGFASLEVSPQEIHLQFHKTDGSIPYEYHLVK